MCLDSFFFPAFITQFLQHISLPDTDYVSSYEPRVSITRKDVGESRIGVVALYIDLRFYFRTFFQGKHIIARVLLSNYFISTRK